jgi:hypothetical protein
MPRYAEKPGASSSKRWLAVATLAKFAGCGRLRTVLVHTGAKARGVKGHQPEAAATRTAQKIQLETAIWERIVDVNKLGAVGDEHERNISMPQARCGGSSLG